MAKFRFYHQLDTTDCGPTCLKMISKYYGKQFPMDQLRKLSNISIEGVSLLNLSEAAEKIGFRTIIARITFKQLNEEAILPCIIPWNRNHFVVVPPQNSILEKDSDRLKVADPAYGIVKVDKKTFLKNWVGDDQGLGYILLLEPTDQFHHQSEEPSKLSISFLLGYLKPYRGYLVQLIIGMAIMTLLSFMFPFLTQNLVDIGINQQNLGFIKLVLFSQLALAAGMIALEIVRSWILLHMNSRITISMVSDFLKKLMNLPTSFFNSKMASDIMQRIADHERVESFLSNSLISILFSAVTLILYSIILWIYNYQIALIFFLGSLVSVLWITFFLKYRKILDYKYFEEQSINQTTLYELILGIQDIKANNSEKQKRWEWERNQVRLFKLKIKRLLIEHYQKLGNSGFLQIKNITISYFAAVAALRGEITLGMMLSISYIIGQMNSPIEQLLSFIKSSQDAKISLERLNEIHLRKNEDQLTSNIGTQYRSNETGDIHFNGVSFSYSGSTQNLVLKNNSFTIPKNKMTAIVGMSGSGKTTLLKLMLKLYDPVEGTIKLNSVNFNSLPTNWWRNQCGVVMQEGYIFSDSIAANIALGENEIDNDNLVKAARVANIDEYIQSLPIGFNTKIGNSGVGLSSGQRLRILIARAVYRNPNYLFLDEATSTLDAKNERVIIENISNFYGKKTVVVIAHRLSTIKKADQILVLQDGEVVEVGTHESLLRLSGKYFELIKNQL